MSDIYYSEKFTFGGLPAENACHWDKTTHQKLGNVVYLITAGTRAMRTKGYNEFYYLKRQFMEKE